ncbi:MAG: ABC transporter permease, partial [Gammaproteobacteria bacterium]|nr:ABC transporter permease [Gammaproteobacteria bacterium]
MNTGQFAADYARAPLLIPGLSLWIRQLLAIFKIEFSKALFSRCAFSCYALALLPVLIFAVAAFESLDQGEPVFESIEGAREVFGYIYSALILGAVVFLGSAAIFTTLFRGEILDRGIHYYLLTPVRREVLVTAKYLAGLACGFVLFGLCTVICFVLLYLPYGMGQLVTDLTSGIATQQLGQYLGITLLACMGYGSVFMATGLLFRNPLIAIVLIAGWEGMHFILPPALKIFSIIYYLKGLLPIPLDEGPLAVIVAPPPVWVSIFG